MKSDKYLLELLLAFAYGSNDLRAVMSGTLQCCLVLSADKAAW
jgi:hypothetical protein